MILPFLLAAAVPQAAPLDMGVLMGTAASRLSAACDGADCAASPPASRYRIDPDSDSTVTSKDRAIRDDGSRCNVVGARRCTKRGRTIWRTPIGD